MTENNHGTTITLALSNDAGSEVAFDFAPTDVDHHGARGDLSASSGNIWITVNGTYVGSLWVTKQHGRLVAVLGTSVNSETQSWEATDTLPLDVNLSNA